MKMRYPFLVLALIILLGSCEKENISPEPAANFSDSYIAQHRDNYFIEIPEVYELANIIMAVKYQYSNNDYFIEKNTSYFQSVIDHFSAFQSAEIFDQFNYSETDYIENYTFRDNSYMYVFNEGQIVSGNIYLRDIWSSSNNFEKHLNEVQAFSEESDFRNFYNENLEYYNSHIALYDSLIPVRHMWDWLEENFTSKYDCYKIIISPLTTGSHSTQRYETDEYKETLMFIEGLHRETDTFDSVNIALNIRIVFTEIDHNYVNPATDKFRDELTNSMTNLNKWKQENQTNQLYDNAYKIFNEYMTWAIFDLYIFEHYSQNIFEQIQNSTVRQMENNRGFIKFGEFEDHLLDLLKNRSGNDKAEDFYPEIMNWVKDNN
ncbi:MAG: DUF4932 domain-containing protein [Bacteroidales bacterium]|jgi:hypothetical protein